MRGRVELGTIVGAMKNMSSEGAFSQSREPLAPKETLNVLVKLPRGSITELSAEVFWKRTFETNEELKARGLGVRFE